MRYRKLQLGLAAAAVIVVAVTLGVRRGVIDVLLMVGIAAAVAGSPQEPTFEYYEQYPLTDNDPDTTAKVLPHSRHISGPTE